MDNIVEIDLDAKEEYINEYDDSKISENLSHYIIESVHDVRKNVILKIKFNFQVSSAEKEQVRNMLYRDFKECLTFVNKEIQNLNVRNIILFLVGVILFFLSYFFECMDMNVFSEFFMVVTWVSFWEVAENFLFVRRNLVCQRKKYHKLLESEIFIRND